MAIEHINSVYAEGNLTVSLGTILEGDLCLILRRNTTAQGGVTGETLLSSGTPYSLFSYHYSYIFAPNDGYTISSVTSNRGMYSVYRGVSSVGAFAIAQGTGGTMTVPGLTLQGAPSTVVVLADNRQTSSVISTPPTDMVTRATISSTNPGSRGLYDTNGDVAAFSARTKSHQFTNSPGWVVLSVELIPAGVSGFEHLDISNSGLINAASGSGNYLELSNSGYIRKSGTEGTNSLILDASGRIITKGG